MFLYNLLPYPGRIQGDQVVYYKKTEQRGVTKQLMIDELLTVTIKSST